MAHWYVKDLAKLTGVSVQTLHHYDRIGLLTPALRGENGYRVYSETDLLKLQQIIALKFFGFELSRIKVLLKGDVNVTENFALQAHFLAEKAKTLLEASQTLQRILSDCGPDKSIPWKRIIELIEVYHMTQELENTWAANVLSPEQRKEYAAFEAGLKTRFTEADKEEFEKGWADLVKKIEANLERDPTSEFGIAIGKQCMDWVNGLYGVEHTELRTTIWKKGYQQDKMGPEHSLPPAVVAWLDKAADAYWRERLHGLLNQVGKQDDATLRHQWDGIMVEMFGNDPAGRQAVIEAAMTDEKVSAAARQWLKR